MSRPQLKYEFTLQEAIDETTPWSSNIKLFSTLFYTRYPRAPLWDGSQSKSYIEDLWKLIYASYYNWYCLECDDEEIDTTEQERFYINVIDIMVKTYDRYSSILTAFEAIKNKLMDQVKSSTETGYNDTPQEEGDYTDETHRTTYTKVTSLIDGATPVERLDEVQRKIRNTYRDWADEFASLFWCE